MKYGIKKMGLKHISFPGFFRPRLISNFILCRIFQAEILSIQVTFPQMQAPCRLKCLSLNSDHISSIVLEDLSVEA